MVDATPWPARQQQLRRQPEPRHERRFHRKAELMLESVRRKTFADWPVPYINPDHLASTGFYYLRTLDHVKCVLCGGIVGYWDPGDQPEVEHRKHFPECPFVTGVPTGNVPTSSHDDDKGRVYCLLDEYHYFRVSSTRPMIKNNDYQNDSTNIESIQMAFPQYNTPSSRSVTFKNWPKGICVSPEALVNAGFFSLDTSDWVQCFHCGGGLFGWREGDNPAADHLRYYPFCPFVRQQQIDDTINPNWGDNIPPAAIIRPLTLTDAEADLLLAHPIATRLVGMGLPKESVKSALKARLEARGIICTLVTEALEIVFDYDELQRKKGIQHDYVETPNQNACAGTPQQSIEKKIEQQPTSTSTEENNIKHQALLKEVKELRESVDRAESRLRCRECKTKKVEVVLQPCSHFHLCSACSRPRDTCPTCGVYVRGTLRPIIG